MCGCDRWLMLPFVCYHLGFPCSGATVSIPFLEGRRTLELAAGYLFWGRPLRENMLTCSWLLLTLMRLGRDASLVSCVLGF